MSWNHVDHVLRLSERKQHIGMRRPCSGPFSTTSPDRVDDVTCLIVTKSEVRLQETSGLELFDKTHRDLTSSGISLWDTL